jgi:hypothetical protein
MTGGTIPSSWYWLQETLISGADALSIVKPQQMYLDTLPIERLSTS